jgi:hypothetical protein
MYKYSIKKAWFSDPSTYPLIVALCTTASLIVGFTINAFTHYKDIRINPDHKHKVIRDWGEEPTRSVVKVLARRGTVGPHAKDYMKLRHEGLGIDHEEWMKAKKKENYQ